MLPAQQKFDFGNQREVIFPVGQVTPFRTARMWRFQGFTKQTSSTVEL